MALMKLQGQVKFLQAERDVGSDGNDRKQRAWMMVQSIELGQLHAMNLKRIPRDEERGYTFI